jgi:hypothetical protein
MAAALVVELNTVHNRGQLEDWPFALVFAAAWDILARTGRTGKTVEAELGGQAGY